MPGLPKELVALRREVAPDGAPEGYYPTGGVGAALPSPLPAGRPMLRKDTHIQPRSTNTGRAYGSLSHNTPHAYAVPPLDVDISLIEICTFFPNWLTIPEVIMRFVKNGWSRRHIAKAQLYARGQLTRAHLKQAEDKVQKQIGDGGKMYLNLPYNQRWDGEDQLKTIPRQNDQTAWSWELRTHYTTIAPSTSIRPPQSWGHVPLSTAYQGVVNWPQGSNRKLLTMCMEFAHANQQHDFDTSHWHLIINHQNLQAPPPGDADEDDQAAADLGQRVADP